MSDAFPHHYETAAAADAEGAVTVTSPRLPDLSTMPPAEFGGPGDHWSPETLLSAAVADCFVLGFRAIARASKVEWKHLECRAVGTLDRSDGTLKFTRFDLTAKLAVPSGVDEARATRVLEKAEKSCLITNSLSCEIHLQTEVVNA
ncbi:MAG: OsmC family protein [Myxococcota bacterium]